MARLRLSDQQWQRVAPLLPRSRPGGRPGRDRRDIVDGILWIVRTGAPWRDLPQEFGPWQTVWRVFDQYNADGTLDAIVRSLQGQVAIDTDLWCIDGSIVRAARCAAGGGKKKTPLSQMTMH